MGRTLRTVAWVIVGLLFMIGAAHLYLLMYRFIPPYEVVSAEPLDPVTTAGGDFHVRYHIKRRRICLTDLDRFIRGIPNGEVVWRDRTPGGAVPVGETTVINVIQMPNKIKPGLYNLTTNIMSQCPDGIHSASTPPVEFEVK